MYNENRENFQKILKIIYRIIFTMPFILIGFFVCAFALVNPEQTNDFTTVMIVGVGFIIIPAVISFLPLALKAFSGKKNKGLEYTGQCIWATVKLIDVDYSTQIDGICPHWVICEVVSKEENTIYRYTSNKVYEDLYARIAPGDQVAVYVNYDDPDDYYVNLNEIM